MFNHSGRFVKMPHGARANSTSHMNHQPANASLADEQIFRPVIRPTVPILTVIDDGSTDDGEQIRIRKDRFVIGRSSGDLTIPNDATMSSRHAEIRLTTSRGQREWTLHNLESVNGTFVRVGTAALAYDTIVLLGSRRFRFEKPATSVSELPGNDTLRIDQPADSGSGWPTLVESSGRPNALRFPLHSPKVTIGRAGSGCDIQLDDPLVAAVHAELVADPRGAWKLIGKTTRNGVWVNTPATALASCCFFQCGEQRFKFVIP
jgi:pSer/pThr/pTyr-binding forkhead associated (FHA) protein